MASVAQEAAPAIAAVEVEERRSVQTPEEAKLDAAADVPKAARTGAEPTAGNEEAAQVEAAGVPDAPRTSLIESKAEVVEAPLWPKEPKEWGLFMLDLAPIGMVFSALSGSFPAIGSLPAFVLSFVVLNVSVGTVKFVFSLRRCGQAKRYPAAKGVADVLGLLMLGVGIWGIAITYPNLRYLSGPASECKTSSFIAAFIPSTIILVVLVVCVLACTKAVLVSLSKPSEGQKPVGEATQQQEKDLEKAA